MYIYIYIYIYIYHNIFTSGGGAEVMRGLFHWFLKHDTGHWQGEQTFETQPWRHSQLDNCYPYPTYDPNHVWCVISSVTNPTWRETRSSSVSSRRKISPWSEHSQSVYCYYDYYYYYYYYYYYIYIAYYIYMYRYLLLYCLLLVFRKHSQSSSCTSAVRSSARGEANRVHIMHLNS